MKIRFLRLIALVLTAAVLLSGCGMVDFGEYFGAVRSLVDGNAIVPYESMTYERPDMTQLQQTLDAACEAAEGDDASAILDGLSQLAAQCEHLIVVSNEVFSGGAGYAGDTDRYLKALAQVNNGLAARADAVVRVVCGIPVSYKGAKS